MKSTGEQVEALEVAQQELYRRHRLKSTIVIGIGDTPELVVGIVKGGSIGLVAAATEGFPPRGFDIWSADCDLSATQLSLSEAVQRLASNAMGARAN
jgi:hypothetical protein